MMEVIRTWGGWQGGFNRSTDDDFPDAEGSTKLQYATVGGVSYFFLQLLFYCKRLVVRAVVVVLDLIL